MEESLPCAAPPLATALAWIDGILYKLFSELGIGGRMWKVINDLYSTVKPKFCMRDLCLEKLCH